jgi:hypoxanthine phosphoribosyltransferase
LNIQQKRTLTFTQVDDLSDQLASKVSAFKPDVVVGIESGGWYPGVRIAERLGVDYYSITVRRPQMSASIFERFPRSLKWLGTIRWEVQFLLSRPVLERGLDGVDVVADKRVLLVDDATHTGLTMAKSMEYLAPLRHAGIKTASISSVKNGRLVDYSCSKGTLYFPWSRHSSEYEQYLKIRRNHTPQL